MNAENTKRLFDKYPSLYADHALPPSQSLMWFGFDHGDGWYAIIDALSATIAQLSPDCRAVQVKEKFGTLRYYYIGSNDIAVDAAVQMAEEMSARTCEECGSTKDAETRGEGWLRTLCRECEDRRGK